MFAAEIRRAVEAAPRVKLPEIAALLWRAYGEGQVTETEATALSELIEHRKTAGRPSVAPRRPVGSRPRSDASMERRRRWAASGRLPPAIAARFTLAESAVLAVVAWEASQRGDCRLTLDHIATLAGVSRSTAKAALRQARTFELMTIEERRATAWRNLSNVVRIVSKEWQAWMRLARRSPDQGSAILAAPTTRQGGGVKSSTGTNTYRDRKGSGRAAVPLQRLPTSGGRPQPRSASRHPRGQ